MELIDFPDEIIIMIAQFIEPEYKYHYVSIKRWKNKHFSPLLSIYDLVCTCKRFDFLRHESFLIFNKGSYYDDYISVNYLGLTNGPHYIRLRRIFKWIGYQDNKIKIKFYMEKYCVSYYKIQVQGCLYDLRELDHEKLWAEIYKDFNDQGILKFIDECENRKNMCVMLIRKQFYKLGIKKSQIRKIVKFYLLNK